MMGKTGLKRAENENKQEFPNFSYSQYLIVLIKLALKSMKFC